MFFTRRTIPPLAAFSLMCALSPAIAAEQAPEPSWTDGLYAGVGLSVVEPKDSSASGASGGSVDWETGMGGAAFVGAQLNSAFRLELELSHRAMDLDSVAGASGSGDATASALMGNALVDLDFGLPITPYFGGGVGMAQVSLNDASPFGGSSIDDNDTAMALQGIAGLTYPLSDSLNVFADYRYFTTGDADFTTASGANTSMDLSTHNLLAGLRWNFGSSQGTQTLNASDGLSGVANAAAQAAPAPEPSVPARTLAETYRVNFEFNKADITDDGVAIIENVVHAVKAANVTRLVLTGHADTMGPADYNMKLSVRRAESVKTALLALGFEADNIRVVGKGETDLLVPTPDNTYEPKNRRVEIILP